MSLWNVVGGSLALLTRRQRRVLSAFVVAQACLAFLDLVGVLLLGVVVALVSSAATGQTPSLVTRLLASVGQGETDTTTLALWLAVLAGLLLVSKTGLSYLLTKRAYGYLAARQAEISGSIARRVLSQPLLFIQSRSSQQTAYALTTGVNAVTLGILAQIVIVVSESAVLVVLAVGLAFVDLTVTIFTLIFFIAVAAALHRTLANWAQEVGAQAAAADIASYASMQDALRAYRELLVSGRRELYAIKFQGIRWQAARVQARMGMLGMASKYVFDVALVVGAGALVASQLLTKDLTTALGIISVFLIAATRMLPTLLRIQTALFNMRMSRGQADETLQLIADVDAACVGSPSMKAASTPRGEEVRSGLARGYLSFSGVLALRKVSFTFPGASSPAVRSISLELPAGSSLALVGPTGAGKSSLVDVILGVLPPAEGDVLIDGLPPHDVVSRWPGAIAYVPQDIALVNGTVRDNVALALPRDWIDDALVWEALKRAHLDDVFAVGRDGLDTPIGEHGLRLSGGQRQRLGLARALYTRPKFLVLDEATSALDAQTEADIAATLTELAGDVTLVVVAHRLATVRHSDQVAYLADGQLLSIGSFEEVRQSVAAFDEQANLLGL